MVGNNYRLYICACTMKVVPWCLVIVLAVVCLWSYNRPTPPPEVKTEWKVRTEYQVETLFMSRPIALFWRQTTDTIHVGDTVVHREQVEYENEHLHAWVSGYRPRLDSFYVFPKTTTHYITEKITITPKPKKWGLGVQLGYGYPTGMYVGVGVSYNLFSW